ncbi:hypothetical protein [Pseudooceanicola atlanticus]|uniref:Ferrochelatase n=1 Tax=Pseudooceanicola atlanticus TaxID=1461694 RepID=A0A0A0EI01_9RHOB|nr:hypothetical protein [Pseudooceanicola atlanticus]KGM49935.1 hypothetical protein ATO9_00040 [Pseudooceanicola atlanticus]
MKKFAKFAAVAAIATAAAAPVAAQDASVPADPFVSTQGVVSVPALAIIGGVAVIAVAVAAAEGT